MVITVSDESTAEVGTVGAEGIIGLPLFLGGDHGPIEIFQQVPGEVIVLPAADFQELLGKSLT